MGTVIAGNSSIGGTINGNWQRGLSAYDIAVQQGFVGSIKQWLESLKGTSVTVKSITIEDDGSTTIVLIDSSGEHTINLPKGTDGLDGQNGEKGEPGQDGVSPTITSEETEDGYNLTITDVNGEQVIVVKNGEKGETGDNGIPVQLMCTRDGVVYWKYTENDNNWKQLIDFGSLAEAKYDETIENHPNVVFVDELPDPENADPNIIYILREEG